MKLYNEVETVLTNTQFIHHSANLTSVFSWAILCVAAIILVILPGILWQLSPNPVPGWHTAWHNQIIFIVECLDIPITSQNMRLGPTLIICLNCLQGDCAHIMKCFYYIMLNSITTHHRRNAVIVYSILGGLCTTSSSRLMLFHYSISWPHLLSLILRQGWVYELLIQILWTHCPNGL